MFSINNQRTNGRELKFGRFFMDYKKMTRMMFVSFLLTSTLGAQQSPSVSSQSAASANPITSSSTTSSAVVEEDLSSVATSRLRTYRNEKGQNVSRMENIPLLKIDNKGMVINFSEQFDHVQLERSFLTGEKYQSLRRAGKHNVEIVDIEVTVPRYKHVKGIQCVTGNCKNSYALGRECIGTVKEKIRIKFDLPELKEGEKELYELTAYTKDGSKKVYFELRGLAPIQAEFYKIDYKTFGINRFVVSTPSDKELNRMKEDRSKREQFKAAIAGGVIEQKSNGDVTLTSSAGQKFIDANGNGKLDCGELVVKTDKENNQIKEVKICYDVAGNPISVDSTITDTQTQEVLPKTSEEEQKDAENLKMLQANRAAQLGFAQEVSLAGLKNKLPAQNEAAASEGSVNLGHGSSAPSGSVILESNEI